MSQIPYSNTKDHPVHIGNKTIMPGCTREVEAELHPDYKPPATAAETVSSLLDQVLDGKVKDALELIPLLSDEELSAVEEQDNRKTILQAVAEERLSRAQTDPEPGSIDDFVAKLKQAGDDMLMELRELHADDEQLLALIEQEIDYRTQPDEEDDGQPGA